MISVDFHCLPLTFSTQVVVFAQAMENNRKPIILLHHHHHGHKFNNIINSCFPCLHAYEPISLYWTFPTITTGYHGPIDHMEIPLTLHTTSHQVSFLKLYCQHYYEVISTDHWQIPTGVNVQYAELLCDLFSFNIGWLSGCLSPFVLLWKQEEHKLTDLHFLQVEHTQSVFITSLVSCTQNSNWVRMKCWVQWPSIEGHWLIRTRIDILTIPLSFHCNFHTVFQLTFQLSATL